MAGRGTEARIHSAHVHDWRGLARSFWERTTGPAWHDIRLSTIGGGISEVLKEILSKMSDFLMLNGKRVTDCACGF